LSFEFSHLSLFCHLCFVICHLLVFSVLFQSSAYAEVTIETSVSRSRVAVGEELTLDIIVNNANNTISKPIFSSIQGFSSYSQGHSQEISIVNGRSSSRSIFSYVLIANSPGKKTIGPFQLKVGDKFYKVAPVDVEVMPDAGGAQSSTQSYTYSQGPALPPPSRALPGEELGSQDIFVKTWLDKDEVYVNESAQLTYTLYTRLSATYKGFEKEPAPTGFWMEDFPPEKTIKRTEKILNGSRYVVADVRKIALFPTQAGIYTIDPGVLSASVEIRDRDDFDSFFSYNVFGRRNTMFPPAFTSQIVSKTLVADKVTLTVRALPEAGKPQNFSGAVGDYRIESSVDKTEAEEGSPVTYRVRILGEGNLNTVETPPLPKMEDFKIYDSSSSSHISKERLRVEGEKVTDTVIVPKKAGVYSIPAVGFSYFDPKAQIYREIKTSVHTLTVKPAPQSEAPSADSGPSGVEAVEKESISLVGKDIRYIKTLEDGKFLRPRPLYSEPLYRLLNGTLLFLSLLFVFFSARKDNLSKDLKGFRFRSSHRVARRRLKSAAAMLKKDKSDPFYSEISKAVQDYFADKLDIPAPSVTTQVLEEKLAGNDQAREALDETKKLFDELSLGRFAKIDRSHDEMKKVYETADRVITLFEKVKKK